MGFSSPTSALAARPLDNQPKSLLPLVPSPPGLLLLVALLEVLTLAATLPRLSSPRMWTSMDHSTSHQTCQALPKPVTSSSSTPMLVHALTLISQRHIVHSRLVHTESVLPTTTPSTKLQESERRVRCNSR